MIIQLLPEQLVGVWPGIQEAVKNVGRIISANEHYLPNVLAALLSGKYQLWVGLDEERLIYGFVITCIADDNLTSEKFLSIELLYGFRTGKTEELLNEGWPLVKDYAKAHECDYIKATTNIPRAEGLLHLFGAKEVSKNYMLRIN